MNIILTSRLEDYAMDELDNRTPIAIEDKNHIKSNIEKFGKNHKKLVLISNNPDNFEYNDFRSNLLFKSFDMTFGKELFTEKYLLDHRNSAYAKDIIKDADVVILCGGKCFCQMKFFKEIKLKKILKDFDGLVIGISAGTMNSCKTVFNFPEEPSDLKERRRFKGLGLCDDVIIPHFDGATNTYDCFSEELDVVNDYILPASHKRDLVGIPNGSYILIDDNGHKSYFGAIYKISKGIVSIIN